MSFRYTLRNWFYSRLCLHQHSFKKSRSIPVCQEYPSYFKRILLIYHHFGVRIIKLCPQTCVCTNSLPFAPKGNDRIPTTHFQVLLFMVQKSQTTTWNVQSPVNNGISTTIASTGEFAGFLPPKNRMIYRFQEGLPLCCVTVMTCSNLDIFFRKKINFHRCTGLWHMTHLSHWDVLLGYWM